MYQVIGAARSRTLRVLWMLEELGLDYEHIPARPHSPDVTEENPAGKIPVLIEGDATLTDSTAIIQYLADKHGALTYPAGTIDRARQDGMTQLLLDEFDAALWVAVRHMHLLPEALRQDGIANTVGWEISRSAERLAHRIDGQPFVMGDEMTVPDIILTHCGGWAMSGGFRNEVKVLRDYLRRMRNRPAYRRALARA
ncbi:glutathione S-transferase family protein [Aliiroseovarius sp. YM-037]|uniref:glutathione S-transferase family protein n=1 Tax=Aliiroseovarius sp. YM-037 TaxID=3341728 RepID=UPI003A802500